MRVSRRLANRRDAPSKTCTFLGRYCIYSGVLGVLPAPADPARHRSLLTTPFACTGCRIARRRAAEDGANRALAKQSRQIRATEEVKHMKLVIVAGLALTTSLLAIDQEPANRLGEAASVFSEVMATPDKGIPQELLEKAHCIVIVPDLKTGAFIFGAKYGKGYLSCRNKSGSGWSAPGTVRIEGGSVGFQIGGSTTDLIMLVMSERGADKLLSSKFTLGAEGSVAAGPVGRTATAQTDAQMHAEILSWSRSQGLFAGLALEGATLRQDLDDNATLYGKKLENRDIVTNGRAAPKSAARLMALLNKYSAREQLVEWKENREDKNEIHQRISDGMRTCGGPGAASSEPGSTVNRKCGQDGRWLDAHLSRYRDRADREGNQLPAPQRCDEDRFPRHRTPAEGPRRGQSGEQAGLHRDRSGIRRPAAGDQTRRRIPDLCAVGHHPRGPHGQPGRDPSEWNQEQAGRNHRAAGVRLGGHGGTLLRGHAAERSHCDGKRGARRTRRGRSRRSTPSTNCCSEANISVWQTRWR